MEISTITNLAIDPKQLPGCRLNLHSLRYFSVHPNELNTYVLAHPIRGAVLYRPASGGPLDLTTLVNDHPATRKAVTSPAFLSRSDIE